MIVLLIGVAIGFAAACVAIAGFLVLVSTVWEPRPPKRPKRPDPKTLAAQLREIVERRRN